MRRRGFPDRCVSRTGCTPLLEARRSRPRGTGQVFCIRCRTTDFSNTSRTCLLCRGWTQSGDDDAHSHQLDWSTTAFVPTAIALHLWFGHDPSRQRICRQSSAYPVLRGGRVGCDDVGARRGSRAQISAAAMQYDQTSNSQVALIRVSQRINSSDSTQLSRHFPSNHLFRTNFRPMNLSVYCQIGGVTLN